MDSSRADASSLMVRMFSFPGMGMSPSSGDVLCCFEVQSRGGGLRGESEILSASAVSQVPLTQNNPYAKAAYFGVACLSLP